MTTTIALIIWFIVSPASSQAQDFQKQEVLDLNFHYNLGQISVNLLEKRTGYLPDVEGQPADGYELKLLDENSKEIFQIRFYFPLQSVTHESTQEGRSQGTIKNLEEASTKVTIPALSNAKRIQVLDPSGKLVLEEDIASITSETVPTENLPSPILKYLAAVIALSMLIIAPAVWIIKKRPTTNF